MDRTAIDCSRTGETFRAVVDPDERLEPAAPHPHRWSPLAVMLGALLGTLVLGWVYIEDHPEVPMAARAHSTNALVAPSAPSASAKPVAKAAGVAPLPETHGGFVAIVGPEGARVFDGDTIVGTVPMLHATTVGAHVIRVQQVGATSGKPKKSQTFNVDVRDHETTPVVVSFDTPKPGPTKRRGK